MVILRINWWWYYVLMMTLLGGDAVLPETMLPALPVVVW